MKRRRFLIVLLVCLLCAGMAAAVPVSAAAKTYKNKLVKVKIKGSSPKDYNYYFYKKNGKKLKKAWKTIKVKGKKRKFYFGKNGKAYKAKKVKSFKYNVAVKKIKSVKYGFGTDAYLLKGLYVGPGFNNSGKIYYFNQKGILDEDVSSEIKDAAKTESDSAELRKLLSRYAGKPKKVSTTNACTRVKDVEPKSMTIEEYGTFEAQYYTMPDGQELVCALVGALKF